MFYDFCFIAFYLVHFFGHYTECKHVHSMNNIKLTSYKISVLFLCFALKYRGADKSLARPGRKQTKTTEDFEFHISYL